eukprot:TRINITY_DN21983_c0_g2_i3.p2 TRINITY_DN21983_c0_g2~~TRINITY_DN21983_c0_g2_i3.p2  ORF type:complete len:298 (-),score=34.75 TRINITY_DN21983_c0_g2_i3:251-1144(-)
MNFATSFSCTRPGFSHQFFHKLNSWLQRRSSSRLQIQAQRLRVQIPTKCVQEDTSDKQIEDIQSSQLEKDQVSLSNGVQASAVSADNKDDELSTLLKDKNAQKKKQRRRQADSTDWVASALTRRFGIVGGLAWLGILAVGTIGEQVKTRLEYAQEQAGTKQVEDAPFIATYSGLSYRDIKIGGGQYPRKGDLAVINLRIELSDGQVVEDTFARGKPIVLYFGGRPFTGGICEGVEEVLLDMKAGGIREVIVPPELGFSERGAVLRPTEHVPEKQGIIPPDAKLFYKVELVRVSIPPS